MILRILKMIAVAGLVCSASLPAQAQQVLRIVIFGDSLTAGYQLRPNEAYPARLQQALEGVGHKNFEVINMSISGETTSEAVKRLPDLLAKKPDIVIVELGANDVIHGVGATTIYQNLATIVSQLKHEKIYVILMGVKAPPEMGHAYMAQLESNFKRIVDLYRVPFYPSILEGVLGHPELNLADGFHPNSKGVGVMVENTYRMVDAALRWKWENIEYQRQYDLYQQDLHNAGIGSGGAQDREVIKQLSKPPPKAIRKKKEF